jgi:flagellin
MRELAVQMENGIYTSKDRDNAQLEVNALLAEVDKIANNTRFNDVKVLDGSYDQTIRAGNTNAETIRVNVGSLKTADNAKIEQHAVEKATDGGTDAAAANQMNVTEAKQVEIDTSLFSATFQETFKSDSLGTFSLETGSTGDADDADNQAFTIDPKTGKITAKYDMKFGDADEWSDADGNGTHNDPFAVGTTIGESDAGSDVFAIEVTYKTRAVIAAGGAGIVEKIKLTLVDKAETQLDDIKVETTADATRAIETLDKALEEVSTAQAKLGAIQNRLSHNIDNLSKGSMLTEQSVGRIVDADFATETSELSKQQILAQAATSMLAQANQSKQSVLALLQ